MGSISTDSPAGIGSTAKSVSTAGATLPAGTVGSNTPLSVLPGVPGNSSGGLAGLVRLPWYYYAGAAVVLYLIVRGLKR